jgi:hypothetical protein
VRSVLVLSFAGSFAAFAATGSGGCGGARPASAPAPVASAPVSRTLADPAVPSSRTPPPRNVPLPGARGLLIPRPGAPAGLPLSLDRDWSSIDSPALDDVIALDRSLRLSINLDLSNKKSDFWSPCVREFVQLQPEAARDALGEALSLYSTSCTGGPVRRVEFQTPPASRAAPAQSYLGLVGALEQNRRELALRAAFHGQVRAQRITLIADGARWSSPRIDFDDDDGWEIATLPLTRELARAVRGAADARDVLLRFESARSYEDVTVTEEMKQDLRVMLDALDAINRP